MRGKGRESHGGPDQSGITPACAGKSPVAPFLLPPCKDHPRVCGEKDDCTVLFKRPDGSPPRVRGKGHYGAGNAIPTGITPACAGKRWWIMHRRRYSWDHPRVCGEKSPRKSLSACVVGSPPRVRGKALSRLHLMSITRITPACAGKSRTTHKPSKIP